jgi:hypothetical protein
MRITKSDFIKFIQCPKYVWLYKHRKDLIPEEIDASLQHIFDEGYHIESYAYKLFPGGIDAQVEGFKESISKTKDLMSDKTSIIFQPTITGSDLFCRGDIIKLNEDGESWDIYEVKSSTEVKEINIHDLAFQKLCFESAGYTVGKIFLVYINNQYIKNGEIEADKLLQMEDISEQVDYLKDETESEVKKALDIIKQKEEPVVRILKQCTAPYACTFLDYCWKDIPKKSIYSIAGGLNETKLNMLLDEGILEIKDIPEGVITSSKGLMHHHVEKHDKVHIEQENINDELSNLEYPLYFLDYETFAPGVPLFDGYRPYQRMTFQYSLHIQDKPGGELKHYEYLAKDYEDPSHGLAEDLSNRIGKTGTVIAWNMSFEKGCNTEMGDRYPEFASFFEDVNNRMFDLMQVFKKGFYVDKEFHGSASLKKVLPVLVPDLSYNELEIHDGGTASNSWGDMINPETEEKKKKEIYDNLMKYCELDTLAMVRILEFLQKI